MYASRMGHELVTDGHGPGELIDRFTWRSDVCNFRSCRSVNSAGDDDDDDDESETQEPTETCIGIYKDVALSAYDDGKGDSGAA